MIQTIKFLIVEPSSLHVRIPLVLKYSPHDPVFKYPVFLPFSLIYLKYRQTDSKNK